MRGRVMSLYSLIIRGGPALGALAMGASAEFTGLAWPVVSGAFTLALATWIITKRIERF